MLTLRIGWQTMLQYLDYLVGLSQSRLRFRCNICGRHCSQPESRLTREHQTCLCGSSVRLRALVHVLSVELFDKSLTLPDFPRRPDLIGIDMSGAATYADRLADRLGYPIRFCTNRPSSTSRFRTIIGWGAAILSSHPTYSNMWRRLSDVLSTMSYACSNLAVYLC